MTLAGVTGAILLGCGVRLCFVWRQPYDRAATLLVVYAALANAACLGCGAVYSAVG